MLDKVLQILSSLSDLTHHLSLYIHVHVLTSMAVWVSPG